MTIYSRIRKSLAYRFAKSKWRKLAIENVYEGFRGRSAYLGEINIILHEEKFPFLLEGYEYAKNLFRRVGAQFAIREDSLFLYVNGLSFAINSAEELFIANEIFVDRCYDFYLDGDVVVIDIGMNVGMASLYFSSKNEVKHVYGFEPFTPTFSLAKRNFELNSTCNKKINSNGYGLGQIDEIAQVQYSYENKGQVGLGGTKLIKGKVSDTMEASMVIKNASEVIAPILRKHKNSKIVMKMDCEGSEFEILPEIHRSGLLTKVDLLMMEWHKTPKSLIDVLVQDGFVIVRNDFSENIGILYAIRQ